MNFGIAYDFFGESGGVDSVNLADYYDLHVNPKLKVKPNVISKIDQEIRLVSFQNLKKFDFKDESSSAVAESFSDTTGGEKQVELPHLLSYLILFYLI